MKNPVKDNLNRILIAGFSIFWMVVLLISYLGYHPYYFTSLIKMPNANMVFCNLLLAGGAWGWWVHSGKPGRTRKVNGLQIYGLFFLMQVVSLTIFNGSYGILTSPKSFFSFLGVNLSVHVSLFLLYTLAYISGKPLMGFFSGSYSKGSVNILSVALGTSFIWLVLFFLGALQLYSPIITGLLIIIFLVLRYRQVLHFWRSVLITRQVYKYKSRWLQLPVFLLISTLAVNGIASIKPFPTGFDGAVLYMNTTHLIVDYQGLIQGGQAYNWQLILSLGEVLFGKVVFSVGIAHFSFLLVLLVGFRLARLLMSRSWSWFVVLLLAVNPSLSFHYIFDEKVDLGFTFITLSAVLLMIEFWKNGNKIEPEKVAPEKLPFNLTAEQGMFIMAGWLLGFAFGIKYTGLFGIAATFTMIGYRYGNYWLSAAILAGFAGALFMLGAEGFAYFPFGDTPPYVPGMISLVTGATFFVLAFRQQVQVKAFFQALFLVGSMAILCFSPWAVRNIAVSGQLGIQNILESPAPTPRLSFLEKSDNKKENNIKEKINNSKDGKNLMGNNNNEDDNSWLLGFNFNIKHISFLGIMTALIMIGYYFGIYWLSAAMFTSFTGALFLLGAKDLGYFYFLDNVLHGSLGVALALITAAVILVLAFRRQLLMKRSMWVLFLAGSMAILCFSPFVIRNIITNKPLSVSNTLESPTSMLKLSFAEASDGKENGTLSYPERLADILEEQAVNNGINLTAEQREQIIRRLNDNGVASAEDLNKQSLLKFLREEVFTLDQIGKFEKGQLEGVVNSLNSQRTGAARENKVDKPLSAGALTEREEMRRYLGYESGLPLYASLPYDLTMNNNIQKSQYIDIGFLFLLLFPILLLVGKEKSVVHNLVLSIMSVLLLLLGIWTVETQEGLSAISDQLMLNTISSYKSFMTGLWITLNHSLFSVTTPLNSIFRTISNMGFAGVFVSILILGGILGWLLKTRWSGHNSKLKYTLVFLVSFGSLWLLMGSGITWYGFPALVVMIVYLLYATIDTGFNLTNVRTWAIGLSLVIYVLLGYSLVFISSIQPPANAGIIYEEPVLRSFGEGLDRSETLSSFKPYLGDAIEYINKDTSNNVYRVGTFFNYHIDYNDRRVLADNQLGLFDGTMRSLNGEEERFINLLKENDFRYILFDMNTATVDRTPEKSLINKTSRFLQMLFSAPNVHLLFTDNIVKGEPGETVPLGKRRIAGRADVRGETIHRGTYLLFEIN